MPAENTIANPTADMQPNAFKAAFDATAEERAALFPADLPTINLDLQLAATVVLGTLPRLKILREQIAGELGNFDLAQFDRIQTYAEAMSHAQTAWLATSLPRVQLPDLVARATTLRDQLLSDAKALAYRGFIDGSRLGDLKGGTGYLAVASDVSVLARMLRDDWQNIQTKTAIQPSELDEADQLYERIMFAYGERTQQSPIEMATADDRQRAFVLLARAYDQARRAATYIRWKEDDLDKMFPSLWAQRGGARSANKAANGNGVQPVQPATPDGNAQPAHPAAPPVAPVAPGLPGGSPFAHV